LRDEAAADEDVITEEPVAPGRRESGKAERRRRIIKAARELIRETGDAGLSMRALAARAGVSLATPYNLFGSKRAIVLAVLDDVREYQTRFAQSGYVDPIERLFLAVDMAVEFYVNDAAFYKVLWAAVFDTSDQIRSEIYNDARNAFWRKLVADAAAAGAVELDPELLYRQLDRLFSAVMLSWVAGEVESGAVAAEIRLGYALMLLGCASPDWRGPLQGRVQKSQARLAAIVGGGKG
jgi:AcrR family transcriptional regulator